MSEDKPGRSGRRRTFLVEVRVDDGDGVYVYKARNLSLGGIFIDSPVPARPGTKLRVIFRLPGGRVDLSGVVRWNTDQAGGKVRYPGMGVEFDELEPAARELLEAWLEPT